MAREPYVTYLLIAINVAMFPLTNNIHGGIGGALKPLGDHLALYGPAVANGEDYRLITAAFVHYGLLHLALNMYALYLIGGILERYVGSVRFLAIYLISALAGSFGALLITPHAPTVGASGAIFGLMPMPRSSWSTGTTTTRSSRSCTSARPGCSSRLRSAIRCVTSSRARTTRPCARPA